MVKKIFITYLILSLSFFTFAQNKAIKSEPKTEDKQNTVKNEIKGLPTSFRGIALGMDLESVKENLMADSIFGYRGDRDISLLTVPNRSSIETLGSSFISRAWFQFYEESLYTISLKLNTDKIDYYSIYSHFVKKYGEPLDINPKRAIWENENTRITIERPLSVKYLDLKIFNSLLDTAQIEKTKSEQNRENFIKTF